jgi:hypothetical protein
MASFSSCLKVLARVMVDLPGSAGQIVREVAYEGLQGMESVGSYQVGDNYAGQLCLVSIAPTAPISEDLSYDNAYPMLLET